MGQTFYIWAKTFYKHTDLWCVSHFSLRKLALAAVGLNIVNDIIYFLTLYIDGSYKLEKSKTECNNLHWCIAD